MAIVLFAVIACGLLVAGAFVVGPTHKGGRASVMDARLEPADYAMQATSNLTRLAMMPTPVDDIDAIAVAEQKALADLREALDGTAATLELAIEAAALPALPAGYVEGAPVRVTLPAAKDYPLPSLPDPDLALGDINLRGVVASGSPVGPRPGTPLTDLLGQVEGLQGEVERLLGGSPVEDMPALPGLPSLGSAPGQVQDANDAVDPDEEGALAASHHAQMVLGLTGSAYGSTLQELDALLALYEQLAERVEDAIAELRAAETKAEGAIEDLLEQRIAAIEADVAELEAQATALVALHAQAIEDAQEDAELAISQAARTQSSFLAATGQAAVQDLTRQAAAVQADADARKAEIQALATTAAADLGSSAEAAQALQAIQAAATAATLKVDREAAAQVADLQAQAKAVPGQVTRAQGRIDAVVREARADVNLTVLDALALDEDVRAYLMAVAQEQGKLQLERENAMAVKAVTDLHAVADTQVEDLVADATASAKETQKRLKGAATVVGQVEDLLVAEVGKDVKYVGDVGEDYGRVPTEDRKARAAHWTTLATGLEGNLQKALLDGVRIVSLAEDVREAADLAETELASLT